MNNIQIVISPVTTNTPVPTISSAGTIWPIMTNGFFE